jgi:hypothetical protein
MMEKDGDISYLDQSVETSGCAQIQLNVVSCLVLVEVFEFMKLIDEVAFDLEHSIPNIGALSSSRLCFISSLPLQFSVLLPKKISVCR